MSDITVTLDCQRYLVSGEGRDATVRLAVRHPVGSLRTIKNGTATWKAAVKQADYERSLKAGAR